jgi:hypothetical protein
VSRSVAIEELAGVDVLRSDRTGTLADPGRSLRRGQGPPRAGHRERGTGVAPSATTGCPHGRPQGLHPAGPGQHHGALRTPGRHRRGPRAGGPGAEPMRRNLLKGAVGPADNDFWILLDVYRRDLPGEETMVCYEDADEVDLVVLGAGAYEGRRRRGLTPRPRRSIRALDAQRRPIMAHFEEAKPRGSSDRDRRCPARQPLVVAFTCLLTVAGNAVQRRARGFVRVPCRDFDRLDPLGIVGHRRPARRCQLPSLGHQAGPAGAHRLHRAHLLRHGLSSGTRAMTWPE